jgi:hypothetical protein
MALEYVCVLTSVARFLKVFNTSAAYFSQNKLDDLRTIDEIHGIGNVAVPEGWFKSARVGKTRRDSRAQGHNPQPVDAPLQPTTPPYYTYPLGSSPTSQGRQVPTSNHLSSSPSPSSQSSTTSSSSVHNTSHPMGHLVPLEYLKNVSAPRRDPADEQLLRRFSS